MTIVKRVFMVDGKPFYPIGGEADNQSGWNNNESETAFKATKLIHGNTLEIAVYWEQIEPEEGKFDFSTVDSLLDSARRYGVKLLLLWFGTWFCGGLDYTPAWIKTNPQRFKRVSSTNGSELATLSSHCQANLEADTKAFVALCKYLKFKDKAECTVIGIQVENEPGVYNSDRDYSAEAQTDFESPVPDKLVSAMKALGKGSIYNVWQEAGGKQSGSWPELFGKAAGGFMTAWSIATYINSVAKAGKAVYNIPMYINVIPGYVNIRLNIYKWFLPHVDIIGPDIYTRDFKGYERLCAAYSSEDNPFFLPESVKEVTDGGKSCQPWALFHAVADYNLIGYFFFGIEYIMDGNGSVRPEFQTLVGSIGFVASAIPLLLKYQGTGKVHAVVQEEYMKSQYLDLGGYTATIRFGDDPASVNYRSWRHPPGKVLFAEQTTDNNRGRGLIIQANTHEFYLVGCNYRLYLHPKSSVANDSVLLPLEGSITNPQVRYLSIDEGHIDNNGEFVINRRRNGGQISSGVWMEIDSGVVRVLTYE